MYLLAKEELVFGKYNWVQVEHQKCHHFLMNTEFFCETCKEWFACPYCHEDALGFDDPHTIQFTKIRCTTCQREIALDDVNCDQPITCAGCGMLMCVSFCKECGISSTKPCAGSHIHVAPSSDLCCVCQGGFDGSLMRLRKMWPCGHCIHYHCFKELKN